MKKNILLSLLVSSACPANPCTDPFYTITIKGKTYSGSTKTAHEAYLQSEADVKRILYDETLLQEERIKRVKQIMDFMQELNEFRVKCGWYGKSQKIKD